MVVRTKRTLEVSETVRESIYSTKAISKVTCPRALPKNIGYCIAQKRGKSIATSK